VASILPLVALFQVFDGASGVFHSYLRGFQVFDGVSAVTGGILRARGRQVSPNTLQLPIPR
jgi:Na+-driven multidrug efflux pump